MNDKIFVVGDVTFSQNNEDQIVDSIFREFSIPRIGFSVEFGGWDGMYLSNVAFFNKKYGDSLLFIEGDAKKVLQGQNNYKNVDAVNFVCTYVTFDGENALHCVLSRNKVPECFDILSIDVDGNDYHIWDSLRDYSPSVVIIEYNFSIPNDVDFIQTRDMQVHQGSSARSLCDLASTKGYFLQSVTQSNLIFVNNKFAPDRYKGNFERLSELRDDASSKIYLFYGYDGTIYLSSDVKMLWQKVLIKRTKFQVLPAILREYPRRRSLIYQIFYSILNKFS